MTPEEETEDLRRVRERREQLREEYAAGLDSDKDSDEVDD